MEKKEEICYEYTLFIFNEWVEKLNKQGDNGYNWVDRTSDEPQEFVNFKKILKIIYNN